MIYLSQKILKMSVCNVFYRFITIYFGFYTIFSILYNFYITILQKTLFSPKRPLRENAHTAKYFYVFFFKKKAPAGKCTHGKNIFNNFKGF